MYSKDPRQGRNSPRPAEIDLRWKTTGRWTYSLRLQHSKGEHSPSCTPSQRWNADLCQDPHRQDHYFGG